MTIDFNAFTHYSEWVIESESPRSKIEVFILDTVKSVAAEKPCYVDYFTSELKRRLDDYGKTHKSRATNSNHVEIKMLESVNGFIVTTLRASIKSGIYGDTFRYPICTVKKK